MKNLDDFCLKHLILCLSVILILQASCQNQKSASGLKPASTTREIAVDERFTKPPPEKQGRKKKGKKTLELVPSQPFNPFVVERQLENQDKRRQDPQYTDPTYFGFKKNPKKKNGKIRKKYAKPPYIFSEEHNRPVEKDKKKMLKKKSKRKKKTGE